jgi:hypothetical protein
MSVSTDPSKTGIAIATPIGSGTYAQMKAVTGMADGAMYLVTNYGRGGSLWRYSASLTDWFPVAPTKVYENTGLITGVAQLADQLLVAMPMEAGLLANKVFRVTAALGKTGTTDAYGTLSLRMGTAGTTADTQVVSLNGAPPAASRSMGVEFWGRMASATSVNKLGGTNFAAWNATGSSSVLNAATTIANVTTQATYIDLTTTMGGTTDSPQVGYVAVEIQP